MLTLYVGTEVDFVENEDTVLPFGIIKLIKLWLLNVMEEVDI